MHYEPSYSIHKEKLSSLASIWSKFFVNPPLVMTNTIQTKNLKKVCAGKN